MMNSGEKKFRKRKKRKIRKEEGNLANEWKGDKFEGEEMRGKKEKNK